jgi:hypothetical protein
MVYKDHEIFIQEADNRGSQIICENGGLTTYPQHTNGAVMRYPYLDLTIKSHVHPKFVIANIGRQMTHIEYTDRIKDLSRQVYGEGERRKLTTTDPRWLQRLNRFFTCWGIWSEWQRVETEDRKALEWKQAGRVHPSGIAHSASGGSATTLGRYNTRSSGSGPSSHGHIQSPSAPTRQVASRPRLPASGKRSMR